MILCFLSKYRCFINSTKFYSVSSLQTRWSSCLMCGNECTYLFILRSNQHGCLKGLNNNLPQRKNRNNYITSLVYIFIYNKIRFKRDIRTHDFNEILWAKNGSRIHRLFPTSSAIWIWQVASIKAWQSFIIIRTPFWNIPRVTDGGLSSIL